MSPISNRRQLAEATYQQLCLEPDPWQIDILACTDRQLAINCPRQSGKSTAVAAVSAMEAISQRGAKILLLGPSFRQARQLFRKVARFLHVLQEDFVKHRTNQELLLANNSLIACMPCKGETIRGYDDVTLLVIDEAARVPDKFYRDVTQMRAVRDGRLICLSTPQGQRGFYYRAWAFEGDDWKRVQVTVDRVPRIKPSFVEGERRKHGESWVQQEFYCSFEACEGLVYPDFARCVVPMREAPAGRWYGGMDFGTRSPFAAVWGVLDRDGVLWLTGEHYASYKSLAYHVQHLPRGVTWYGDPQGAREILELHVAGVPVRGSDNAHRPGIAAVRSRLETGTLKILAGTCPNLLREAQQYRYNPNSRSEDAFEGDDHAMDALRYLISKLDWKRMALVRRRREPEVEEWGKRPESQDNQSEAKSPALVPKVRKWLSIWNEALWTRLE